jgi:thiamine-phosphate pyrophosphorylase
VTDRTCAHGSLSEAVRAAVAGGVDWVQIREPDLDGSALLALAEEIARAARAGAASRSGEVKILVNRRIDVALALPADGAHLGHSAMPPFAARELLPAPALLGVATHAPEEAVAAANGLLDYVHLAPIYEPVSKPRGSRPLGPAALRKATGSGVRVLAQGGLDADRCREVLACGAVGVAVTGTVLQAESPGRAAAALRAALDSPRARGGPMEPQ